jgi:hypothetical protein
VAGVFLASQPTRSSEICSDLPHHLLGCGAIRLRGLGFLYRRFSSLLRDEACPFRNQQAVPWSGGDHGSIWDSWPIALISGYPRGLGSGVRLIARGHTAPNFSAETRSRTRVSREPDGHRQRKSLGWSGFGQRHSSCLWFQMLGVEAHSSLPHDQHDGGNLPSQGQTRHLRPYTSCCSLGTLPSVGDEANTQQPTPGASLYIASAYSTRHTNEGLVSP